MARKLLFVDIETYSTVDLRKTNVYRYAEDPAFEIMMAAWSVDGKTVKIALGETQVLGIPGLWDPDVLKIAHNSQFERVCFSKFVGLSVGEYLDPEDWHDTAAIAGVYGYPQSLAALAPALGVEEKDSAGTRLINLFCKPNRKGERVTPEEKPEEWADFIAYCKQDVATLIAVHRKLGGWPTHTEKQIYLADQRINDRGIAVDLEMARLAVQVADDNRMVQELEISALIGVTNPGSGPQMLAGLKRTGLQLPNLQAATIEEALEGDLTTVQRSVLTLRQELALVASKKYTAALNDASSDGRLRGGFRFFGAHTGRWTGRGVQLQNLPRAALSSEVATKAAILDLKLGLGADAFTLKALVRALFVGPFTVVDYAAIEARVVAWLAGEEWALEAFRDGRDIYVETANRISRPGQNLTRSQGKTAVLALGYNGGINSLKVMGAEGSDDDLEKLVQQWRRANQNIVQLWGKMGNAIAEQGEVGPHLRITRDGSTMRLHLPSGRWIEYHGLRWEHYRVTDPKTGRSISKESWRYDDPKRAGQRIGTYGGRLVENATQAVARDIMAEALVRLQDVGYDVVGHVHDEVLVDGLYPVEKINRIMTETPGWATGMPIGGAGFSCFRYMKG